MKIQLRGFPGVTCCFTAYSKNLGPGKPFHNTLWLFDKLRCKDVFVPIFIYSRYLILGQPHAQDVAFTTSVGCGYLMRLWSIHIAHTKEKRTSIQDQSVEHCLSLQTKKSNFQTFAYCRSETLASTRMPQVAQCAPCLHLPRGSCYLRRPADPG